MSRADDARFASFPSTCWSQICQGSGGGAAAWERLAHLYWKPIHAYLRAGWTRSPEAAEDLTQGFFAWMLQSDLLQRADPGRGRFRAFIKTALANYVRDQRRKEQAVRRGGGRTTGSADPERLDGLVDPGSKAPEELLDDVWRAEVVALAVTRLEEELLQSGRRALFEVFREYFLDAVPIDYQSVAARHGITTVDVSNYLTRAKQRYRSHLRTIVLETVQHPEDLEAELRWLFGKEKA